jgi:hypothetical protein
VYDNQSIIHIQEDHTGLIFKEKIIILSYSTSFGIKPGIKAKSSASGTNSACKKKKERWPKAKTRQTGAGMCRHVQACAVNLVAPCLLL